MEFILRQIHNAGKFGWLYLANLFLGFHFFSVAYVNSSFLAEVVSQSYVGLVFSAAALLGFVALSGMSAFLQKFGVFRTAVGAALLDFSALMCLVMTNDMGLVLVLFAVHSFSVTVILFCLDIFLENKTVSEEGTGNVRGIFLSIATLAALFAPVLAGLLAGELSIYKNVYFVSGLFLVPFIIILVARFRNFVDPPHYELFSFVKTLRTVHKNKNFLHISAAQFLMRFYFSWMVIYLPIYLHTEIGFSWPEIGLVLFIMLVPYVLVEWPAGMLADGLLGEKELLMIGFVITGLSTIAVSFLTTPTIALWGAVLFATRIGTALIESMTETYFFKQVDGDDASLISFFRMLRPLAYITGPLAATAVLYFTSIQYLWIILAGIMFVGILHALALVDTR